MFFHWSWPNINLCQYGGLAIDDGTARKQCWLSKRLCESTTPTSFVINDQIPYISFTSYIIMFGYVLVQKDWCSSQSSYTLNNGSVNQSKPLPYWIGQPCWRFDVNYKSNSSNNTCINHFLPIQKQQNNICKASTHTHSKRDILTSIPKRSHPNTGNNQMSKSNIFGIQMHPWSFTQMFPS